jgi:hypothetical protein
MGKVADRDPLAALHLQREAELDCHVCRAGLDVDPDRLPSAARSERGP